MTNPQIYVGTVGADLQIKTNEDLITDVASVTIKVRRPSGVTSTWTPTIDATDPENCTLNYRTTAGDLPEDDPGTYRLQPVATMTNGDLWPLGVTTWQIWPRYEGI